MIKVANIERGRFCNLACIVDEMPASSRAYCSNSRLLMDNLPLLLSVVQPSLRPVNTQLYSAKEKAELANLVDIHLTYNITYQQERNADGQVTNL